MRLAGTCKQYSPKAISQLMTMTLNRGAWRYFRCPYQAKVMKMLERVRSRIVVMQIRCLIPVFGCKLGASAFTGVSLAQWQCGRRGRPDLHHQPRVSAIA